MKRIILFLILTPLAGLLKAQTDMITALQSIGDKVEYTEYWDVTPVAGGKNTIGEKRYVVTLHPVTNKFGKVVGFDGIDTKEAGKKRIEYYYMHGSFDHYTHPSRFFKSSSSIAYVIINGVIFELEKFKDENTFDIDKLWIPSVPKSRSSEAIFNGAKMSDLRSADLKKTVTDYLTSMKKIQDANPYSDSVSTEVAEMKFAVDSTRESYKQTNANYWNSPEGKKKLAEMRASSGEASQKTIKNTGSSGLTVIYDNGMTSHINPGSTSKFPCSQNIYYARKGKDGRYTEKGTLISGEKQDCGKTLTAAEGN